MRLSMALTNGVVDLVRAVWFRSYAKVDATLFTAHAGGMVRPGRSANKVGQLIVELGNKRQFWCLVA
jgi:hypothetical protein